MPRSPAIAELQAVSAPPFDLVVIGGGITGAGLLRDAALRGMRAVLFEKGDFASGTSSRSSKLVHGGLRYLETFDFNLIAEALHERQVLLRIAPDLVRPLPFLYPVYRGHRRGLFMVGCGVWMYDLLSRFKTVRHPSVFLRDRTLADHPHLNGAGLKGAVLYHDAVTNDANLTVANLLDAWNAGTRAFNHVSVTEVLRERNHVVGVGVRDERTGETTAVRARWVVNVTGPWSDGFLEKTIGSRDRRLRVTKGTHIFLRRGRLPASCAFLMHSPTDARVTFLIPWQGFALVGTTDTDYDGDLDRVTASEADVDYLLDVLCFYFPAAGIGRPDVLSTFAGLRPLLDQAKADPSSVSREHRISFEIPGFVSLNGGKLTSYRKMAKQLLNQLMDQTPEWRGRFARCSTSRSPLPVPIVARFPGSQADLRPDRTLLTELIQTERARTISDILVWRTFQVFLADDHGRAWVPLVRECLAEACGLDGAELDRQEREYEEIVRLSQSGLRGQAPGR